MIFKLDWERTDLTHQLPEGMVEKMLHLAFLDKELQFYSLIAGGCANLNYKIQFKNESSPYILRVYIRDKDSALKERSLYKLLKATVPVPQIYFVGEFDNYRFAIVEFINGITLRDLLVGGETYNLETIMYDMGLILTKISEVEFPKAGFFDQNLNITSEHTKDGYLNYIKETLNNHFVLDNLSSNTIIKINLCLTKYKFPDESENHLVHADFDPANILITKTNGNWKITAILDWEFSFSGSTLYDVANMLRYKHKMPSEFEKSFLRGLKAGGIILPESWRTTVHMLNLLSLLDCLVRSDPKNRPNQLADIKELIEHILLELYPVKLIQVVPYNENWPEAFAMEAEKIKQALGDNCIEVHHIGSTSVPGLAAKPIIDILPVVKDIRLVAQAIPAMKELGYEMGKELFIIPDRRMFAKTNKARTHNVHIFELGAAEIDCHLKYRDWLRTHPKDCKAYAELKKSLAEKFPDNMFLYYSRKEEFILNIGTKSGWDKLRTVQAYTLKELQTAKALRQKYIFDPNQLKDPYLWTFDHQKHVHFLLYKGAKIIGYTHIQLWPKNRAALRIIAIDENYRNNGYGGEFLKLCEKYLKFQEYKSLHIESSPEAYSFYKKYGYIEMAFNDPDNYESNPSDIPVGKIL